MELVAPWPKSKVTESLAFEHTGLEYFRPFSIKKNKERKKPKYAYSPTLLQDQYILNLQRKWYQNNSGWRLGDLWDVQENRTKKYRITHRISRLRRTQYIHVSTMKG